MMQPFSDNAISFVAREVVKALAYINSLRIVHRDIKGSNILITADGNIKVSVG